MEIIGKTEPSFTAPVAEKPVTTPVEEVEKPEEKPVEDPKAQEEKKAQARWAQMARKEKWLRSEQEKIQKERELLAQERTKEDPDKISKTRFLADPLKVMQETGLSYEQLTQAILNGPKPEDMALQKLQEEIRSLRENQTKTQDQIKQQTENQYKEAVKQITHEVKQLVSIDPKYELIKSEQAFDAVTALIEETFQKEGTLMSVEDACNDIEEYLTEEALRLVKLGKIQSRLSPKPAPTPEISSHEAALLKQPPKTLSHQTVQTGRSQSDMSRRERAIAAFLNKVNT